LDHNYCHVASAARHENAGGAIRTQVEDAERWVVEVPLIAAWKDAPALGCRPGDCHYLEGNLRARARADAINLILEDFGLEPERFRLEWVSASEGPRFAQVVTEMVEQVRKLGPNPYRTQ
jgi:hypothetical protein